MAEDKTIKISYDVDDSELKRAQKQLNSLNSSVKKHNKNLSRNADVGRRVLRGQAKLSDSTGVLAKNINSVNRQGSTMRNLFNRLGQKQWSSNIAGVQKLNNVLNNLRWAMVNVTFAVGALAAVASPFVLLTKAGMEWEQQLIRIRAVTEGVFDSTEQLSQLSQFLKDARVGTPFDAQETAMAFREFIKAGFGAQQATEALPQILDLAAAGFIEVDEAAEIVAATLNAFAVQGLEAQEAIDVIAKAAIKSALDVDTFGSAMSLVAPVAANLGFTFRETAAAVSILANAGLRGSKAGRTLRQVLNKIQNPSEQAKTTMRELGISFFDAEGNALTLSQSMRVLEEALSGMSKQAKANVLGDMFGIRSRVGVSAFLNLLDAGDDQLKSMTEDLDDVGFASEVAADNMEASAMKMKNAINNLKDSAKPLAMAFNDAFSAVLGVLEKATDTMGDVTSALGRGGSAAVFGAATVGAGGLAFKGLKSLLERGSSPVNPMYVVDISNVKSGGGGGVLTGGSGKTGFMTKLIRKIPGISALGALGFGTAVAGGALTGGAGAFGLGALAENRQSREPFKEAAERISDVVVRDSEELANVVESHVVRAQAETNERIRSQSGIISFGGQALRARAGKMRSQQLQPLIEELRNAESEESMAQAIGKINKALGTTIKLNENIVELVEKENEGVDEFSARIEVASDKVSGVAEDLADIRGERTPIFTDLSETFGSVFDRLNDSLERVGASIDINANAKFRRMTEFVKRTELEINNLEESQSKLNHRIRNMKPRVDDAKSSLDGFRDALSSVEAEIDRLSGTRFAMETAFQRVIHQQELFIAKQELAALGVEDAQAFIQSAVNKTGDEFDGVVKSIEEVERATEDSRDAFKAWQQTVREVIRSLVVEGNNLEQNVTQAVVEQQTSLMSVSRAGGGRRSGKTEAELQLERLKLAQEVVFGDMRQQVQFFIQEEEDRRNGVARSSDVIISSLEKEFNKRSRLESQIDAAQDKYDRLKGVLNELKTAHDENALAISNEKFAIEGLKNEVLELAESYRELASARVEQPTVYDATQPSGGDSINIESLFVRSDGSNPEDFARNFLLQVDRQKRTK